MNSTISESEPGTDALSIGLGERPPIPVQLAFPAARYAWYVPVKVTVEWVAALWLLVFCSPLLLVLAAMVRLTSCGPALYAQTRLGRSGRPYRIYKFRTMRHDAEFASGPVWAAKNDVRVTPLGRLLRDTHLDELPQLWNVLRGEMGLIGPRPERPEIAGRICRRLPEFACRLTMRPGVTGLAQMLLPADDPTDAEFQGVRQKLEHDLVYLREVSPLLDLKIVISTSCYFVVAVIDAVRRGLLRSYSRMVSSSPMAAPMPAELELGAA
jgi:lipopolysaccharide/colanic/teichoic acid biosynthesis glycosyltransferase